MSSNLSIPGDLAEALRGSQHILVLTGSGISAESGVPTFRDAQDGLWAKYQPEDLATADAFLRDPELVWKWYRWRRELVAEAKPNPGHTALAELAREVPQLTLITQNVDGLHQQAGSTGVIEFHGNLFVDRCFDGACSRTAEPGDDPLPTCPSCAGLMRPGVVWFGEAIPPTALELAVDAIKSCDMFISIGTSALVWPAAGFVDGARQQGATTLEVNPNPTPMSDIFDYRLAVNAGEAVPALLQALAH